MVEVGAASFHECITDTFTSNLTCTYPRSHSSSQGCAIQNKVTDPSIGSCCASSKETVEKATFTVTEQKALVHPAWCSSPEGS